MFDMFELLARCSWVVVSFTLRELCDEFGDLEEFLFIIIRALFIMP